MGVKLALLLTCLVLAGCTARSDDDAPTPQPPSTTAGSFSFSATTTTAESPSREPESHRLTLDGCDSGMSVAIYAPTALYPAASSPADWSGNDPLLVINLWLESCARVSIGPFERGPVHFLIEMH